LFEDGGVLHALFGAQAPTLDAAFERLADEIERALCAGSAAGAHRAVREIGVRFQLFPRLPAAPEIGI